MGEQRFTITAFKNRRVPVGTRLDLTWEEIWDKFHNPVITEETADEYTAMTNEEKTDVKDVGGYVAGELKANRRSKASLIARQLITIDADRATLAGLKSFMCLWNGCFLAHTTHTSTPDNLRLRYIFPLSRPVNSDEYRYLANYMSEVIGLDSVDESTDQPERLMFWPSVSFDGYYECWGNKEGDYLNPDSILPRDLPISAPVKEKPVTNGVLEIAEGQRNKTVFGFAATLRGNGLDQAGIRAILDEYNERYCNPPLEAFELDTIARSVCSRYEAGAAVAASLRDAWDDFNDLGEWKEKKAEKGELSLESLSDICQREMPEISYAVDGLIASGLTVLASPPKFGKSWMCLDLALSVAAGKKFMGFDTTQRGVLYLALEDGPNRIKKRTLQLSQGEELPANIYIAGRAPSLAEDLLPQIEAVLAEHKDIGLIIIDTLQKIRGVAGRTEGVYGYDYRELGKVQSFAISLNLAVVLVHHLNKGGDDTDFVSRLNGSTGISGAADTIITLTRKRRGDKETVMSVTGRDANERTLIVERDPSTNRWLVIGEERDVERARSDFEFKNDPLVKTIIGKLDEAEELLEDEEALTVSWSATASSLLSEVEALYGKQEYSAPGLGKHLSALEPKLLSEEGITHEYSRQGNRGTRLHVFTREII